MPTKRAADGIAAVPALLHWAGGELAGIGLGHTARSLELCRRADGWVAQVAVFDPASGDLVEHRVPNGYRDGSVWSRAQAWALLGLGQAALRDPGRFVVPARELADAWVARVPTDAAVAWDLDDPAGEAALRDTSAAAIAAAALLKIGRCAPGGEDYERQAREIASTLVAGHLTAADPPGRLLDGCYNGRKGFATDAELIWGTYFLLETLLAICGTVDPTSI